MVFGQGKILDEVAMLTNSNREDAFDERVKPMSLQKRLIEPDEIDEIKVGVVGSGPAGLTCADFLNRLGYSVNVFEKDEHPWGFFTMRLHDEKGAHGKTLIISTVDTIYIAIFVMSIIIRGLGTYQTPLKSLVELNGIEPFTVLKK